VAGAANAAGAVFGYTAQSALDVGSVLFLVWLRVSAVVTPYCQFSLGYYLGYCLFTTTKTTCNAPVARYDAHHQSLLVLTIAH